MPGENLDSIILRIGAGDMSALAGLYREIAAPVYSYSLSVLKNSADAEDVLSEVILGVQRGAAGYKSLGKPMAWVMTAAKNACLMKLRDQKRLDPAPPEDLGFISSPDMPVEDRAALKICFEELSDQEREVIVLHAVAGLKHREISKLLGLKLSAVLSRYNRVIKKLRNKLECGETEDSI